MNHGNYDDDDDDDYDINNLPGNIGGPAIVGQPPAAAGAGRGGYAGARGGGNPYAAMGRGGGGGGFGMGMGMGGPAQYGGGLGGMLGQMMAGYGGNRYGGPSDPSAYDEYYKAYSVAIMEGPQRDHVAYGGKIIMPPSALGVLTNLDMENPYTFLLRNPKNPSLLKTYGGVLEFIANEGCVYLPYWMMTTLNLNEGDPVRLTGAKLVKGKGVKIQAQSMDFLQVSDHKAVLEKALRDYSCLSKNDIIEIQYNSLVFGFKVVETTPDGPGIFIIDTDLVTEFDTPKGYVSPPRPKPVALPTMADKLKIDLNSTTPSAGSTRPSSAASSHPDANTAGGAGGSGGGGGGGELNGFESFKGTGTTLNGKKLKGKGKARTIEEVDPFSKINRTDKPRMITNEMLMNDGRPVPAPLDIPPGKIFVGFKYVPFDKSKVVKKPSEVDENVPAKPSAFGGSGATLSGRGGSTAGPSTSSQSSQPTEPAAAPVDHWAALSGGGVALNSRRSTGTTVQAGSTSGPTAGAGGGGSRNEPIEIDDYSSGSEFNGFDDDDDAIMVDDD